MSINKPNNLYNPFHLVEQSPWPFTSSASAMLLMFTITSWFHLGWWYLLPLTLILISANMIMWWRDVIRESSFTGFHTYKVQRGMEWGMILFITSEVMFFFAFFWAFFHSSLAPTPELGCMWPPTGITPLNPFAVPLLNTAVLLSSGVTVTWAHHSLLANNHQEFLMGLMLTVTLGIYFTYLQATEYFESAFTFADSAYGSTFFIATGFHGLHVLIGSTFLLTCLYRGYMNHYSTHHHFGLEAAAWYWHFVDVVWIFLFLCIYWWGTP